jgi:hypothetical protein
VKCEHLPNELFSLLYTSLFSDIYLFIAADGSVLRVYNVQCAKLVALLMLFYLLLLLLFCILLNAWEYGSHTDCVDE